MTDDLSHLTIFHLISLERSEMFPRILSLNAAGHLVRLSVLNRRELRRACSQLV